MAKFEEIGVVAVVDGFSGFILKLTAMNKNVKKFGTSAGVAATGVGVLNLAFKALVISAAAAVAVIGLVVAGVAIIAAKSVQTAASFETAFAGILKTTTNLGTNLFDLSDAGERVFQQFRDLAKEIPLSFEELARIGEFAGQLGIPEQALAGFTETVAALGASTELTTEEAALGLARIGNVYTITADEMSENTERLGSTIVFLGNNFNALEPEILRFASMMAGTAKAVNISQAELLAISTAFVSVGVRAEAGGSSVQRVLLEMSKAVQKGGEDLENWADAVGVSAKDFEDAWSQEGGPAKVFNQFVQQLAEDGEGASLTLEKLDVDTIRVLRTFLSGAGAADILSEALIGAESAWENNTALAREAEIRYATLDSQIQILKNRFRDMGTTIGLLLIPAISDFIKKAQPFIEAIANNLKPALETVGDSIRENLLPAIESLISAFTGEEFDFDKLNPEAVGEGVIKLGEAIATHTENISGFIEDMAVLVGLMKDLGTLEGIKAFSIEELEIPEETINAWSTFIKLAGIFLGALFLAQGAVALIVPAMGTLGSVVGFLLGPFGLLALAIGSLIALVAIMGPTVKTAFEQVGVIIRVKMEEAGQAISEFVTTTSEKFNLWLQESIATISEWATNLGITIANFFTVTLPEKIAEGIAAAKVKMEEWGAAIREKWEEIKLAIAEKWDEIKETISGKMQEVLDSIGTFVTDFVQAGKDIVGGIVEGIKATGADISSAITGFVSGAWQGVKDFLKSDSPSKLFAEIGETIPEGLAVGVNQVAGMAEGAITHMISGSVNAAEMLLPATAGGSQTTDRSFNMGDMNVSAQPEDPVSIAQRLAQINAMRG